jgi:TRAP-type C4-dicarboxylate transport system substrate-binding protein
LHDPQTIAPPETYEALKRTSSTAPPPTGTSFDAFSLTEVLKNICDVNVGPHSLWFLVNKDVYEGLDDELKGILTSWQRLCLRTDGEGLGLYPQWVIEDAQKKGIEVYKPSAELDAAMVAARRETFPEYIKYCDDLGVNGQEVFDKYQDLIAKYADKYADPWNQTMSPRSFPTRIMYYVGASAK